MSILNLGAGNATRADAVNHDRVKHRPEISVAHDLNVRPWPWKDSTFDLVIAHSVLEHLALDLVESLDECWRILKPEGLLYVKGPYWKCDQAFSDPQHRWQWAPAVFDYFDPETESGKQYGYYTTRKWRIEEAAKLTGTAIHITLRVRK